MAKRTNIAPPTESKYSVADFAAKARGCFGVSPECVITAFSMAAVTETTLTKAKEVVRHFMEQKVS